MHFFPTTKRFYTTRRQDSRKSYKPVIRFAARDEIKRNSKGDAIGKIKYHSRRVIDFELRVETTSIRYRISHPKIPSRLQTKLPSL